MTAAFTFSSKADIAYAALRGWILSGELKPGSKLAQYELAEELGISITPLREAIRRLSGEGLVTLDNHKNTRVAAMDFGEARALFETRRALEPVAVGLAAERRTDEDVARMRAALDRLLPVTREWGETAIAAHTALHRALYSASHNAVMVGMLDGLWDKSDRYRRIGLKLPPGGAPRTRDFDEHRQLVELVVAGEGAVASELMCSHIDHSLTADALEQHEAGSSV